MNSFDRIIKKLDTSHHYSRTKSEEEKENIDIELISETQRALDQGNEQQSNLNIDLESQIQDVSIIRNQENGIKSQKLQNTLTNVESKKKICCWVLYNITGLCLILCNQMFISQKCKYSSDQMCQEKYFQKRMYLWVAQAFFNSAIMALWFFKSLKFDYQSPFNAFLCILAYLIIHMFGDQIGTRVYTGLVNKLQSIFFFIFLLIGLSIMIYKKFKRQKKIKFILIFCTALLLGLILILKISGSVQCNSWNIGINGKIEDMVTVKDEANLFTNFKPLENQPFCSILSPTFCWFYSLDNFLDISSYFPQYTCQNVNYSEKLFEEYVGLTRQHRYIGFPAQIDTQQKETNYQLMSLINIQGYHSIKEASKQGHEVILDKHNLNNQDESNSIEWQAENLNSMTEQSLQDQEKKEQTISNGENINVSIESTSLIESKKKMIKYKTHLIRKYQKADQLYLQLGSQKKFYLFVDQLIDLEYFKNINNIEDYLCQNQQQRLFSGVRSINLIEHRMDSKCIELNMQTYESKPQQIDYLIEYMKSLGNKDLLKYTQLLKQFKSSIEATQTLIRKQIRDPLFQQHYLSRKQAGFEQFKKITSQLDGTKFIQYTKLSINYEKQLIESNICGFTPSFYELLSTDSYSFKDQILKYGYFDPITQQYRLDHCLERAIRYLNSPPINNLQTTQNHYVTIDLTTCDNFRFPVELRIQRFVLDEEYDKEHNLSFEFRDILNLYEFTFKDNQILNQFTKFRREQRIGEHTPESVELNFDIDTFSYKDTEFFQKYYGDQKDSLIKKGNKWFKRCGFTNIPKKKFHKEEQNYQQ